MPNIPVIFEGSTTSAVRSVRRLREEMGGLTREEHQVSGASRRAHSDLDRLGRGALAGSGLFRHLGRSVAFASGTFLGAAGFIDVVRKSIDAARDIQIQVARSQIVFGDSAKDIQEWAKTADAGLSLAQVDAIQTANAFGTMLTAMGVAPGVAAGLSKEMTKVAAAISLARGEADPDKAVRAIVVALAGRGRALRQYGIILDETNIKAEAVRLGLLKTSVDANKVESAQLRLNIATARYQDQLSKHGRSSTQAASALLSQRSAHDALAKAVGGTAVTLTNQQKAQAAASLVMRQGARFTGDYKRLLQTTAGQQRQFTTNVDELQEALGQGLLPTFTRTLRAINPYLHSLLEGGKRHKQFQATTRQVGDALRTAYGIIRRLAQVLNFAADAVGGWGTAFKLILTLYLANKFLALSGAIRGSRIALLLLGRQAVVTAATVETAEAGMATGAVVATTKVGGLMTAVKLLRAAALRAIVFTIVWNILQKYGGLPPIVEDANAPITPPGQQYRPGRFRAPPMNMPGRLREAILQAQYLRRLGQNERQIYDNLISYNGGGYFSQAEVEKAIVQTRPHHRYGEIGGRSSRVQGPRGTGPSDRAAFIAVTAARSPGAGGVGFHLPGEAAPYDCSAFVQAVYRRAGIHIGRDTYTQVKQGRHVSRANLRPGDLIFMNFPGERSPGHVGIYVGNGMMVHDHGAHGGVEYQSVPWGSVVDTRTYADSAGGGPSISPGADTTTTGGVPGQLHVDPAHHQPHRIPMATRAQLVRERHVLSEALIDLKGDLDRQYISRKQYAAYVAAIRRILRALARPHLTSAQFSKIVNQYHELWDKITRAVRRGAAAQRKAIADAEKAAEVARSRFEDAWSKMADRILEAYDRVTAAGEDAIQKQFAALTPAERALQALEARRSARQQAQDISAAQTKLQRAREIGDPAMIAEAMAELQDAQDNALEAQLQSQADIERAAADAARDKALRDYDDQRAAQRDHLQDMLDDLEQKLEDGTISWSDALTAIKKLIGDNVGDFATLGALIGKVFMQQLLESIVGAGGAAGPLAKALKKLRGLGYHWDPDTQQWVQGGGGGGGGGAGGGGGDWGGGAGGHPPPDLPDSPASRQLVYPGRKQLQAIMRGPDALVQPGGGTGAGLTPGGDTIVHVHMYRYLGDKREAAQEIRSELLKIEKANPRPLWSK